MSLPVLIVVVSAGVLVLGLAVAMFFRGSRSDRRRSRDEQALIRSATRALASNPKDINALSLLGEIYFNGQEWEKAAGIYANLLDQVANNHELDEYTILFRHGLASMQISKYQDAYRSLMLAWRERKDVFEINFNLGRLELMRKRYERAAPLLMNAHAARPEHLGTLRHLGQAYFRLKRFTDAVESLSRVVESEVDDTESAFFLGQAYYELGQQEQAAKVFRRLRRDPSFGPRASLITGSIHLKNRDYDQAELDFRMGLEHEDIQPDVLLELHYRLAATHMRRKDVQQSLEVLGRIARINPSYKDVAEQIGRARELAGNQNLQTYLMASTSEFVALCRKLVTGFIRDSRSKIQDVTVNRSESADVLALVRTPRWEDTVLFRMMRTTGQVGELVLRDLHSRMKDLHAGRGYCISAGTFSEGATEFVEARFIDLVPKDELVPLLKRL
jgi:tetratricopeptide (TPR) repeat protein